MLDRILRDGIASFSVVQGQTKETSQSFEISVFEYKYQAVVLVIESKFILIISIIKLPLQDLQHNRPISPLSYSSQYFYKMPSLMTSIVLAVAFLQATVAMPTNEVAAVVVRNYPEVVPGPGLPSLASLNLTSAELYEMVPVGKHPTLPYSSPFPTVQDHPLTSPPPTAAGVKTEAALFTLECGPEDAAYTNVNGLIACFNYLNALGTTSCGVPGYGNPVIQMCYSGDAQVIGQSITGDDESSYCRDVATAVLDVINGCTRPDQSCAGFDAAYGNGDLIIGGVNTSW